MMLLFADDLVNCADTVGKLQIMIKKLDEFCIKWGLRVNLEKTKVMLFRNEGMIRKNEKWFLNGVELKLCTYYKYLGLTMSNCLCWGKQQKL